MERKVVSGIMLTLLLIGMLTLAFNIQPVKASGTIYIRPDGSVDPPTAPISSVDKVTYTFTDNIVNQSIVVERDNIVVDGAGCTLQGTGSGKGIDLTGRSNVTIKNVEIKAFKCGICLHTSPNNTIYGNTIIGTGFLSSGVRLAASSNNTVSANNITNNWIGVHVSYSSNNIVSGNTITNNNPTGVHLFSSSNNTVSGNDITNNDDYGVYICESSDNIVSGNNVTNNYNGVYICREYSSDNTVSGNDITNNDYGIYLDQSSDNMIFHNSFINNTYQAYVMNAINTWDDGYPSGGNYWSDHVCAGNPSDGSQPYIIDANNIDHYPFQDPNGWINTLTIYSSPTGVTFTVDGVSRTTPWSGTYSEGTSVSLAMPEIHTFRDARYYWSQWGDENTSRLRTVTMTTNITLTAYYTGPYYELTVTSSPMTGITFIINGTPQTTPYTEWLLEGSYTLEMPETHNGYVWSHWLEDGDPNRIKIVTMDTNIALTAVFAPPDTTPPTISILSPENKTYPVKDVPSTFTVSESTSWIGYSLDGQANITIAGDTTLTGLSDGMHSLVVYASDIAGNMGSSDMVHFTIDTILPSISIVSPENKTYDTTDIPLTFTIDESVLWMAYSLDGQANTTITGNTTLSGLSDGSHSLTVYAKDTAGNTGASETIYFSIAQHSELFPTWIAVAIVIIAVVAVALLVYFAKVKKS